MVMFTFWVWCWVKQHFISWFDAYYSNRDSMPRFWITLLRSTMCVSSFNTDKPSTLSKEEICLVEGQVTQCLAHWTLDVVLLPCVLGQDIQTFLHHNYIWALTNLTLDVAMRWTSILSRRSNKTCYCFRNWVKLLQIENSWPGIDLTF